VDQVNTAVSQMDKTTQQNAAGAEESASAAEELSAQAVALKSIINNLATVIRGSRAYQHEEAAVLNPMKTDAFKSQPTGAKPFTKAKPAVTQTAKKSVPHNEPVAAASSSEMDDLSQF
jgi:methyl-accepting chemotaxis protein